MSVAASFVRASRTWLLECVKGSVVVIGSREGRRSGLCPDVCDPGFQKNGSSSRHAMTLLFARAAAVCSFNSVGSALASQARPVLVAWVEPVGARGNNAVLDRERRASTSRVRQRVLAKVAASSGGSSSGVSLRLGERRRWRLLRLRRTPRRAACLLRPCTSRRCAFVVRWIQT